jgi:hypothetical protein
MMTYDQQIVISGESISSGEQDRGIYEYSVKRVLDQIASTDVGSVVLAETRRRSWTISIWPADESAARGQNPPADPHAASTDLDRGGLTQRQLDAAAAGVTPRGQVVGFEKRVIVGTGTGADVRVNFTPRQWVGGTLYLGSYLVGTTVTPERVLVHELVHAVRRQQGLILLRAMCCNFGNEEEFFAILIENLFVSEYQKKGQPGLLLRANNGPFRELPPPLKDSQAFFNRHEQVIRKLNRQMPNLTGALAALTSCDFNPLRAFVQSGAAGFRR